MKATEENTASWSWQRAEPLKQLSMQNMRFLDFSVLSQQISRSINARGYLHNAGYIKEIKLWWKRGINLDVIFQEE